MEVLDRRCAGLDVHQKSVVACARVASDAGVQQEVASFETTTRGLLALSDWLSEHGCTHVAMESTGSSFVPPTAIQELRDLTRTRKQLVREITQHTQRIQKALEDANIKLTGVISNILGRNGRMLLRALIAGESAPSGSWRSPTGGCTPRVSNSSKRYAGVFASITGFS
jgi:transposase